MAIVMVMTLLPTSALAVGGGGEPSETNSGAVFSKTATQDADGNVKITLEAWATGQTVETTKQQPLDIVLVLDQSGSMAYDFSGNSTTKNANRRQYAMKNAVNGFIDEVAKNYTEGAAHRISIVTFNDNASQLKDWTSVDETGKTALKTAVNELPKIPSGATNVAAGMAQAQTQLSNAQKDHKKVVVVFTDGVPTTQSDFSTEVATNAILTAKALKADQTEIYTIGIFNGVNANQLYGEKWAYLAYHDVPCTGEVGSYWGGSWAAGLFGRNDFADIDVAAGNRFLNYLSSNFAEATEIGVKRGRYDPSNTWVKGDGYKITQNFESSNSNYYLTATDSASLNNVFTQISENINSAVNEKLDTKAVVKDTMTEYFKLPANTDDIKVYTQNYKGNNQWGDPQPITAKVEISNKTVTVTGYDYAKNFVSETAKADGSYGQKLVIEFTITPDLEKLAQAEQVEVDTNTGAGLYLDENKVATGKSGEASFCGVKYNANDGEGDVPPTQIGANGTEFTVPASCTTLKKNKAVLLGFSATKRDALVTSESDAAAVVTEYTPAKDTLATLYAVWAEDKNGNGTPDYKETKYTITYVAGTTDTVTGLPKAVPGVLAGTEQTVSSEKPTREGYTFSGWQAPEGVTVTDNKFTMPKNNVTFTAQWTANDVTITFNANGGEWAENANVDDYTLIDNNTKASKTYQPSEAVAKIATDPVWNGHTFNGWYVKIPGKTGEEPEKYFITVWDATLQAQRIQEYGGVIYADWDDAAQPTEKLNYTTRQHYINEKGVEKLAVNITVQSAEKGTEISKLIQHLETDQTYYGQKYLYDDTKTTVNGVAYAKTMTLDTKGTAIDLYYYLDEWNDENDKVTGGDGTPDCQQAVVNFLADPNGSVGKDSEKPTQVFTLKKGADGKYSDSVTPANVTPIPKENFAFDIWTKDNGETGVNPFVAQTLNGGDKVTYTAHFAADKIGPENKPDVIPDKYQAVVTYKVVGGTWKDGKTDDQVQVFTLKTKKETGVWEDANPAPVLGETIPTGMISSYSRTASQSWDKDITKDTKVTESVTYTYTFTQGSSGGGGGSSSTHYYISLKKVDAQDGEALSGAKFGLYLDGKQIATATSDRNGIVRFSMGSSNYRSLTDKSNLYCQELTAPEGYKLSNEKIAVSKKDVSTSSSMSDKNAKTVKNSRSKTPSMLNGKDHFAYIVGYPDKTVHPQSSITRAEVATIFFRLLTEETRTANATKTNNYADVSSDKWYNQAVSTLSAMGIIKGDSRGNFNPNAPITRAEFAAIAARFDKTEDVAAASFGDVATHWAKPEISVAANNGWINGYTDGTFHPDSRITRAEAMAMINRVLQRLPESKADLLDGMIQWSDNADTSKWYYLAVQEATNSHYYELKANQHEKWTKLRENRDWTELEK